MGDLTPDVACERPRRTRDHETRLAATVVRLRAEAEGLRRALMSRAVIEQATGLLAGRMGCGLSTAFRHLNQLAQDTDAPLAEAAALLLGEAVSIDAVSGVESLDDLPVFQPAAHLRQPETVSYWLAPSSPRGLASVPSSLLALLDVVPTPVTLLSPVRSEAGQLVDFHIEYCNDEVSDLMCRTGAQVVGGRLLELYPATASNGVFSALAQVLQTGAPLRLDLFTVAEVVNGEVRSGTVDIRARRVGDSLLVGWRLHDADTERVRRLAEAERLGHLGWAEWNLFSNTVVWSEQLYAMHGRDPLDGPVALDEYARLVHPDDLPIVEGLVRGLMERREDVEVEFRITVDGMDRHIRIIAQPVLDPEGNLMVLRGVFQDVTARRRPEQALAESRAQVERQRREATLRLQRAVLPADREALRLPSYEVAVRYMPAQSGNKVGGDWYEACELPDGRGVVAVGDVAGHGLAAAAGMARVGNALRGLAVTGHPPAQLVRWLNQLVCRREAPEAIASVMIGYLDPRTPRLSWVQAGHPAPVLVRGGEARLLTPPSGALLGVSAEAAYGEAVEPLEPGDLVLLYTDGLVEHRGRHIQDGISALLDAARACTGTDPARDIDTLLAGLSATERTDDVCLLAIRVTTPRARTTPAGPGDRNAC